ncbi:MAG: AAA family ATPase [Desulfobacterales bacterium]|nr:AAA family ATPase [Desulfobacterales bacterium]
MSVVNMGIKKEAPKSGFRLAVAGKGGAGKTTLVALLAELFARNGYHVLATDEDPQMNLALSLGVSFEEAEQIVPLSQNNAYIEEKTGASPGSGWGGFLRLNPDVSDVVERFGLRIKPNLYLVAMGSVEQADTGCLCPQNNLLKAVLRHIVLKSDDIILTDTQAGPEHFGRGLLKDFSLLLVVAEPTAAALQVAKKSVVLAKQLRIAHQKLVVNKVQERKDQLKAEALMEHFGSEWPSTYFLPYAPDLLAIEPQVASVLTKNSRFARAVQGLFKDVEALIPLGE